MKNNEFIIGCNYWASNAGTEMWVNWDENAVRSDLKILSENGIKYLRVFPNWRDFQPVIQMLVGGGAVFEYMLEPHRTPENKFFLEEKMLDRFEKFCDVCKEYGLKLIVGLLTGFMSGRMFVPAALLGKNLFSDSEALYFEQLFIKGFVRRFKDNEAIYAWDHGNECNCMGYVKNKEEAAAWTMAMSNAIYSEDKSRPIISGIHSLTVDRGGAWTIEDQAANADMLVTHPYPFWSEHASSDKVTSIRPLLYPIFLTKYYADIGKRPCLTEEVGTMGPAVCSDEVSKDFINVVLHTIWAGGHEGVMWWCANEQTNLATPPYTWNMCETELGLIDSDRKAKPVLKYMKKFSGFLSEINMVLPEPQKDVLCISQIGQDSCGVSFMSYILLRQAGLNPEFCFCNDELPEYPCYMLPSYKGNKVINLNTYKELKKRVWDGADIYISYDGGILSGLEDFAGFRVENTYKKNRMSSFEINGRKICISTTNQMDITPINAKVILKDNDGIPIVTVNNYGKGHVYFVTVPVETALIEQYGAFEAGFCNIYKLIFSDLIAQKPFKTDDDMLVTSYHYSENSVFTVLTNCSDDTKKIGNGIDKKYAVKKVYSGNADICPPFETVILELEDNKSSK